MICTSIPLSLCIRTYYTRSSRRDPRAHATPAMPWHLLLNLPVWDQRPMSIALKSNCPQDAPAVRLCHMEGDCSRAPTRAHERGRAMPRNRRQVRLVIIACLLALIWLGAVVAWFSFAHLTIRVATGPVCRDGPKVL